MGAAAFTQYGDPIPLEGSSRLLRGSIALSASYATGGDTIDWPGDLNVPDGGVMLGGVGGGRVLEYDGANQKVKAYQDNGTATAAALPEVANATNLSTVSVECWVLGAT
jgi:hypothetical protein